MVSSIVSNFIKKKLGQTVVNLGLFFVILQTKPFFLITRA